jgi:hypothetical protein
MAGTPYPPTPTGGPFPPTVGSALGGFMQAFAASMGARVQEAQEQWKMQHDAAWEQYQAALDAWKMRMNIVDQEANRIYQRDDLSEADKGAAVQQLMASVGPLPQRPTLPPFPTVQNWVNQSIFHRAPQAPAAPRPPALPAPAQPASPPQSATPRGAGAWRPWRAPSPIAAAVHPAAPPAGPAQPVQPGVGTVTMLPSGVPWISLPSGSTMTAQQLHDRLVRTPEQERLWQNKVAYALPYRNGKPDMTAPVPVLIKNLKQMGISNPGEVFSEIQAGVKLIPDPRTGKMVAVPVNPATGDADFDYMARAGLVPSEADMESGVARYALRVAGVQANDALPPNEKARRLAAAKADFYRSLSSAGVSRDKIDERWNDVLAQAEKEAPSLRSQQLAPIINPRTGKPMMAPDAQGRPRPMMVPIYQAAEVNAQLMTQNAHDQVQQSQFSAEMGLRWADIKERHDSQLEARAGRLQNDVIIARSNYDDAAQAYEGAASYLRSLYVPNPKNPEELVAKPGVDPREIDRAKQQLMKAAAVLQRTRTRLRFSVQSYNGFLTSQGMPPVKLDVPEIPLEEPQQAPGGH